MLRFFYGEILHVIPKVLSCFFGTKKIDFLKFGVSMGDKMAVVSCHDCLTTSERFHIYGKTMHFWSAGAYFCLVGEPVESQKL